MRFQLQVLLAVLLASGSAAFSPVAPASRRATELSMAARDQDFGKAAASILAAGFLAVSSVTTVLPVEPVFAAPAKQEKVEVKKLAPEEKNKIAAKDSLDLANSSLKEYSKLASEAKSADTKATSALKKQESITASAKKAALASNDKLSAAKNQKMPQTAIKELSDIAGEWNS